MLFTSAPFGLLLVAVLAAHWSSRSQKVRLWVLLTGSLVFYGWRHWPSIFLLLASIGFNYALGLALERRPRRWLLGLGVMVNLASLAWFKYSGFVAVNLQRALELLGLRLEVPRLGGWLPLGISFFTFQVIAYLVAVYRSEVAAERSLLVFAVFKSFYAQLVAGPIVRAKDLLPQLQTARPFDAAQLHRGAFLFLSGLFLKLGVADVLAQFADQAFADPAAQSTLGAWLGVYAYSVQIFADFWGYSTMAVGLGLMVGLSLPRNFALPYFAPTLQLFWRRWHITLSEWFRDHVYLPLGGNRRRPLRNVVLVMALAGLWHGAGWTFVLWGLLHGLWLAAERAVGFSPGIGRLRRVAGAVAVFQGVCLLWVLFRAPSIAVALAYYRRLLLPPYSSQGAVPTLLVFWLLGFALLHAGLDGLFAPGRLARVGLRWQLALTAAMLLVLLGYGDARLDFIYFVF